MAARNIAKNLAIRSGEEEVEKWVYEDIVPKAYHHFRSVFVKESLTNYLQNEPWDMRST